MRRKPGDNEPRVYDARDLLEADLGGIDGELWKFDSTKLCLYLPNPKYPEEDLYWFDLGRVADARAALDLIVQVSKKSWCTDAVLASLVHCLNEIFSFQRTEYAGGAFMRAPDDATTQRVRAWAESREKAKRRTN